MGSGAPAVCAKHAPCSSFLSTLRHSSQRPISFFFRLSGLALWLSSILGVCLLLLSFLALPRSSELFGGPVRVEKRRWESLTLQEAVGSIARNGTVIVCVVSQPYLPFLSNWLGSVGKYERREQVLVIAEDYGTLYAVNEKWPGHAVIVPPVLPLGPAHRFGSQGFFNFTSRRPRHLLQLLRLGYSVLYNDVDMVWLKDPFPFFKGNYDIYLTDDMVDVKPHNHSHELPAPGKKGRTYICSCMLFLRPTPGAKLILRKWIEELQAQPWSPKARANDQPAFNWALNKSASQVNSYLLPQYAFPSGGLYFKNETWREETKGKHAIVHNNYITGFEKKIKRFHEHNLWFVDDHPFSSPLLDFRLREK
eukprot:c25151_g1_i2 orf=795-1886(-)